MHHARIRSVLALFAVLLGCAQLRAEEQTARYLLIGLFEPSRGKDFKEMLKELPELRLVTLDIERSEVTLGFDLPTVIPNSNPKKPPKPEEIMTRIDNLLSKPSQGTFRVQPIGKVPLEKLSKIEIPLRVHDCRACRYGVYSILLRVDGVERAMVTLEPNRATVWFDSSRTNRAALESALDKQRVPIEKMEKQE